MAKKKTEPPEMISVSDEELESLLERVKTLSITDKDAKILESVISTTMWIQQRLKRAKLTIRRLQKLFGFKTESNRKKGDDSPSDEDSLSTDQPVDPKDSKEVDESSTGKKRKPAQFDPTQNHGRLGGDDYTECDLVNVALGSEFSQKQCPECLECDTVGKLYCLAPQSVVVLSGRPLISGVNYQLERARCSVCQHYFTANLPEEAGNGNRYQASCATSIAIHHYYAGVPFARLEMLQQAQGIPLPDATQYDLMCGLHQTVVAPVFKVLRQYVADSDNLYFDDTPARILEQMKRNKLGLDRKAVHGSALLGNYEDHHIYFFSTSTKTAGAELAHLLSDRQVDTPFITMSDASSSNFPDLDEKLLCKWMISLCLVHSRRKFVELMEDGADDIKFILSVMGQVYHHERYCKQQQLDDQTRLLYHQQHSQPLMESMRVWLNNLLTFKQVEPNSALGEAIIYLLKHWQALTQFYRLPGAALDNNLCERAIKVLIRYRKNSLFYGTHYSASVGDAMMSVIHTAAHANINVFDYLNTLQGYSQQVNDRPEDWLPWNYQKTREQHLNLDITAVDVSYAIARHADTS